MSLDCDSNPNNKIFYNNFTCEILGRNVKISCFKSLF